MANIPEPATNLGENPPRNLFDVVPMRWWAALTQFAKPNLTGSFSIPTYMEDDVFLARLMLGITNVIPARSLTEMDSEFHCYSLALSESTCVVEFVTGLQPLTPYAATIIKEALAVGTFTNTLQRCSFKPRYSLAKPARMLRWTKQVFEYDKSVCPAHEVQLMIFISRSRQNCFDCQCREIFYRSNSTTTTFLIYKHVHAHPQQRTR